jgi:hypothetical protein
VTLWVPTFDTTSLSTAAQGPFPFQSAIMASASLDVIYYLLKHWPDALLEPLPIDRTAALPAERSSNNTFTDDDDDSDDVFEEEESYSSYSDYMLEEEESYSSDRSNSDGDDDNNIDDKKLNGKRSTTF